jgi:hypothetical protein
MKEGKKSLDFLIRADYTGNYSANRGHAFSSPGNPDINLRPRLTFVHR